MRPETATVRSFLSLNCRASFTVLQSGLVGTIWNAGWASGRRMIWEYAPQADAMKRAHLRDAATGKPLARYHYLFVSRSALHILSRLRLTQTPSGDAGRRHRGRIAGPRSRESDH